MNVARVHVRSWQAGYRGLLPAEYLDQLRPEDRAARYDFATRDAAKPYTIVALDGARICGFATTMPARDVEIERCGELTALYVDPDDWGQGVGAALISEARTRLVECGFQSAILWILAGNARAARFYERDGWVADGAQKTEPMWNITTDSLRYRRALP